MYFALPILLERRLWQRGGVCKMACDESSLGTPLAAFILGSKMRRPWKNRVARRPHSRTFNTCARSYFCHTMPPNKLAHFVTFQARWDNISILLLKITHSHSDILYCCSIDRLRQVLILWTLQVFKIHTKEFLAEDNDRVEKEKSREDSGMD